MDSALAMSMVTANASRPCERISPASSSNCVDVARRERHPRARFRQRQRARTSNAPAGAGDESGSICHETRISIIVKPELPFPYGI